MGFLFFICFLWAGLIGAYMPLYFGRFDVFILCFIILELSFSIFGIKGWDGLNRQARYTLIISNERAIRFPRKSILPFNSKKEEIFYKNVDYITFDSECVIIVEKSLNGEYFYRGDEKEYKVMPKGVKRILFYLATNKVLDIKKKILDILIDLTKAKKHPNLPFYISTE